jgi:hypothetical protein
MADFLQGGLALAEGGAAQDQAEANAAIDRQDAAVIRQETRARTLEMTRRGRQVSKQVRTQAAASGFAQEGTPLVLQAEIMRDAEISSLEEQRIGLTDESRKLQSAALNVQRGKTAKRLSFLRAGSHLASGIRNGMNSSSKGTYQRKSAKSRVGETDLPLIGGNIA